ncbi:hypothetical protein HS088_TW21G00042 [Tripterygium wilfordii]|uniref:Uncharacterized protein n=1 Tax=Tripterygium wilfordii TaxID=458696 RepID=A0A7J7C1A8_TRIWF|nr:hypothetical protein HS088_TW21G00042 [Tripterygium wilfordii]
MILLPQQCYNSIHLQVSCTLPVANFICFRLSRLCYLGLMGLSLYEDLTKNTGIDTQHLQYKFCLVQLVETAPVSLFHIACILHESVEQPMRISFFFSLSMS